MADEQKAAEEQQKAYAEALAADPIGGKPPIDIAHERAAEENDEPLGYVDPKSQEQPDNYAPDPAEVETPSPKQPAKKAAAKKSAGVTRSDAKGDDNG